MSKNKNIKDISQSFALVPAKPKSAALLQTHITNEEHILETQIRHLRTLSEQGPLTLEEVKMLDLLIKNKRLVQEKSTLNAEFTNLPSDISDDDLAKIAASTETDEQHTERNHEESSSEDPLE